MATLLPPPSKCYSYFHEAAHPILSMMGCDVDVQLIYDESLKQPEA